MRRLPINIRTAGIATGVYVALWCAASFIFDIGFVNTAGWAVFYLIGLCWTVFAVKRAARRIEAKYRTTDHHTRPDVAVADEYEVARRTWNPLDPAARFYGTMPAMVCCIVLGLLGVGASIPHPPEAQIASFKSPVRLLITAGQFLKPAAPFLLVASMGSLAVAISQSRKLRHSLATLAAYSLLFMLVYFLAHIRFGVGGDEWSDDLPAGGGTDSPQAMSVKVQKVIRKKYVVNPYSSILFAAPPPIDNIDVKLAEETSNRYQVGQGDGGFGQGDGEGGGFGSGTAKGKINWYRLRHSDRGWDKNFNIGGDYNLLLEFVIRYPKMKGKIGEESTSIDSAQLASASEKAPPYLVHISGYGFAPTAMDKKALKQYVMERHGMILGDSLGPGFGGGFEAAMNEITGVKPVTIPRDDPIHKNPYQLPQLPFVVSHNGSAPIGWRVDGRWAVYWHPGALSDFWRDDRAGISRKDIVAQGYELGLNIMAYATKEQNTWRKSQKP